MCSPRPGPSSPCYGTSARGPAGIIAGEVHLQRQCCVLLKTWSSRDPSAANPLMTGSKHTAPFRAPRVYIGRTDRASCWVVHLPRASRVVCVYAGDVRIQTKLETPRMRGSIKMSFFFHLFSHRQKMPTRTERSHQSNKEEPLFSHSHRLDRSISRSRTCSRKSSYQNKGRLLDLI
jgi:hypothetical protein